MDWPTGKDEPGGWGQLGIGSGEMEITLRESLPEGIDTRPGPDLTCYSPDGRRVAVWKYSGEISMGVGRFEVRWGEAGQAFDELSPVVLEGFENDLLYPPVHGYQPWTWDSQRLLLTFFGRQRKRFGMITFPRRAPVLWEVGTGTWTELDFMSDRFNAALAAPTAPVLVLVSRQKKGHAGFFDLPEGRRRGDFFSLSGQVCWQVSSGRLLAVVQEKKPRQILLQAYDPNSARLEGQVDLTGSIMAVLPAETPIQTRLGGLYLQSRNTVLSMDQLHQLEPVVWDLSGSRLYLGCWRPSGTPVHERRFGRRAVLPVVRNWVEIATEPLAQPELFMKNMM